MLWGSWQFAKNMFMMCTMFGSTDFACAQFNWQYMLWLFVSIIRKINNETIRHFLLRHNIHLFCGWVLFINWTTMMRVFSPSLTAAIFAISDIPYSWLFRGTWSTKSITGVRLKHFLVILEKIIGLWYEINNWEQTVCWGGENTRHAVK